MMRQLTGSRFMQESTTGIGEGIAIPHGKCDAVDNFHDADG